MVNGWGISCETAPIWVSLDHTYDKSTLVPVMAWCRQATSHYLSQCWPRSLSPYGVTRPQWVKCLESHHTMLIWWIAPVTDHRDGIKNHYTNGGDTGTWWKIYIYHFDGLVQERCNSSALAMELRLSCNNPSIWCLFISTSHSLTLKWLGHFFQSVALFSNVVHHKCNIFILNWSNTMNV